MRTILTILFICNISLLHADSTNYVDYHKQINIAEQFFLYNNSTTAIKKYKEIFNTWSKPFAKDCFITLQVACMIYDTASAKYFFIKCFENGVEWETALFAPRVYELLNNNYQYRERIKRLYEEKREKYLNTRDTTYAALIRDMFAAENKSRGESNNDTTLIAKWMSLEDSNMYALVDIIKERGFPGEKRVGFYYYDQVVSYKSAYSTKVDYTTSDVFLSSHVATMFFHHHCGYELLKEELWRAVVNGELHPREYALMYEWSHKRQIAQQWDHKYHIYRCELSSWDKYYNLYIDSLYHHKDTELVNANRAEIGICTIQHDEKKRNYAKENRLLLYMGMFNRI